MRAIDKHQDIAFHVHPDVVKMSGPVRNIEEIFDFIKHNQSKQIQDHRIASMQQKIHHVVVSEIDYLLLDELMTQQQRRRIVMKAGNLLCPSVEDHPFENFGLPRPLEKREIVIADFIHKMTHAVEGVLGVLDEPMQTETREHIHEKMRALTTQMKLALIPESMPSFMHMGQSVQQEALIEVRQEVRQEVKQEIITETTEYRAEEVPVPHWSWGDVRLPGTYRKPLFHCHGVTQELTHPISLSSDVEIGKIIGLPEHDTPYHIAFRGLRYITQAALAKHTSAEQAIDYLEQGCLIDKPQQLGFFQQVLTEEERRVLRWVHREATMRYDLTDQQEDSPYTLSDDDERILHRLYQQATKNGKEGIFFDLLCGMYDIDKARSLRPPILSAGSLFSVNPELSQFQSIFDPRLLATYNFSPLQNFNNRDERLDEPFHLIKANDFVIVKTQPSNEFQLIFISQRDLAFFAHYVAQDKTDSSGTTALGIYNLNLGMIESGKLPIMDQELQQNEQFQTLLVQAKFLAGVLNYTDQEQEYLYHWLSKSHVEGLEDFFEKYILKYEPEKQRLYPESMIKLVFKRIKEEPDLSSGQITGLN